MPLHDTMTFDAGALKQRPIYGPFKRAKRGVLRACGRWSRADYDVQFVYDDGRIAYKKIIFNRAETAARVVKNLQRFGTTEHLPQWRHANDRAVWIDYIEGRPYDRAATPPIAEIARCFGEFAGHHSRRVAIDATEYWSRHQANLERLADTGLMHAALRDAIGARSLAYRPSTLRIGFDYRDPIAPNLVERADTGRICAIDLKNWHADTLVGQGLAKATDRWLAPHDCARVLDHMAARGLNDVADSFDFICLYERVERLRRRVDTDIAMHGRIRKRSVLRNRLATLATQAR